MSNNDKFIRDTEFGKLMESQEDRICYKCKYYKNEDCLKLTDFICDDEYHAYFAKDEPNELSLITP